MISSIFITVLLLSFNKTMNRLTKPVSFFIIISLTISEVINFILYEKNISGSSILFRDNFQLFVDRPALITGQLFGSILLLIMLFSVFKLKRRNGYVRYFVTLGFFSGIIYIFSFSGALFHDIYDPIVSNLDKTGIFL